MRLSVPRSAGFPTCCIAGFQPAGRAKTEGSGTVEALPQFLIRSAGFPTNPGLYRDFPSYKTLEGRACLNIRHARKARTVRRLESRRYSRLENLRYELGCDTQGCGASKRPGSKASRGFTLVELVISASLMTIILASAYLCLNAGTSSQRLIENRSEVLQKARVALAMMTADLRSACAISPEIEFLGMHRMIGDLQADNLDFATHNYRPKRPHEGDFCEVSYYVDQNRQTGQFSLWRRRNPTIAVEPLNGGSREEIVPGVLGLRIDYYDGFEWYEDWGEIKGKTPVQNSLLAAANLSGLPEAVRITLLLDADPRSTTATSARTTNREPPLVFQTVARLNLAPLSYLSTASGGGSSAATNSTAPNPTGGPSR